MLCGERAVYVATKVWAGKTREKMPNLSKTTRIRDTNFRTSKSSIVYKKYRVQRLCDPSCGVLCVGDVVCM